MSSKMIYPKGRSNPKIWVIIENDEQEDLVNERDPFTLANVRKSKEAEDFFRSEPPKPKKTFTPKPKKIVPKE